MIDPLMAFFAFAWPFIAAWLVFRFFPASLTKFVEKEIDRHSDAKLERVKAELQASYSTVKTSVDVLTASNSAMHPHIIEAVSTLWSAMVTMRDKFGTVLAFDSIILPEEAREAFGNSKHAKALELVQHLESEDYDNKLMNEFSDSDFDNYRLFCGDRLWLVFYIYRAVIGRSTLLISWSFKESTFRDWREDKGIEQLLGNVMGKEEVKKLRDARFGGLSTALAHLEGEYLHEATRVMSGSKAMADSLADMQAMMLLQNAVVAERGS